MKLHQTQKMTQKLILTPQMKQSLHILQLPVLELKAYLEKEIEENPVVEREPGSEDTAFEKIPLDDAPQDSIYQQESFDDNSKETEKKNEYRKMLITKPITLTETLLRQLNMCKIPDDLRDAAEFIILHLDDNGYLNLSLEEIAELFNAKNSGRRLSPDKTEEALYYIQRLEPAGIGARNLKECLLLQLKAAGKEKTLEYAVARDHLADVAKHRVRVIAKKLKARPEAVRTAIERISRLEPKPGRLYSASPAITSYASYPDVVVEQGQNGYEIIVNAAGLPRFSISRHYRNILKSKTAPQETKVYVQEKIRQALTLQKSISQRDHTLREVMRLLLDIQKDFFNKGDISLLRPLTFKKIAKQINRNESTISRVVNNKYVQTPHGTFKLNYFFTKPLKTAVEGDLSRESIKSKIFHIIHEETKKKPLNDADIARLLSRDGAPIARRTVAKYREELKIPPAHQRKQGRTHV